MVVVFVAVPVYGVRRQGLRAYLKSYMQPNPVLLPLNILGEVTRTVALAVRLFGNVMSGVFIIGIVLSLAGLFVPKPFEPRARLPVLSVFASVLLVALLLRLPRERLQQVAE